MFNRLLLLAVGGLLASSSVEAHPHTHRHNAKEVEKRATTPTIAGWYYAGCVTDGGARALPAKNKLDGKMTAEMCTSWCASAGYTYAGLEARNQCYCDNSLKNGLGVSVAESDCNYVCDGNNSEACGGYYRLNLWRAGVAPTSTKAIAPSTTPAKTSTTTSKPATTSTTAASVPTTAATFLGCYSDSGSDRTLTGGSMESYSLTPATCSSYCSSKGFAYAGTSYGKQCWCGNSVPAARKQSTVASCSYACTGDKSETCGGFYYLDVYCLKNCPATVSTSTVKASTTSTTSSAAATTSNSSPAAGSSVLGAAAPPAATGTKALYAHHMVGNTYSYTQAIWADDINQAKAAGIDGFALNYGRDSWQVPRMNDAYAAAKAQGSFKLFLSMDVSSLGCSSANDAVNMVNTIASYANNTAQAKYNGKTIVSTFAGEDCTFGQGSMNAGWTYFRTLLANKGVSAYFVPAVFSDVSTFKGDTWMDAEFNWNGAWPMGSTALDTSSDTTYMNALGTKGYMAAVSPAFFTYYSPSSYNKDWIYRSDDWLLARRMEQLIAMRNKVDLAEIISWNDYGESHYIGPIRADQPNSQGWTNGMPHTAWLSVVSYYAQAFKSGSYPSANDQMVFWTRPHPKAANPTNPTVSRPTRADATDDLLYVWLVLKAPATVTITSGTNTASWNLNAGVNKVSVKSGAGAIGGKIVRSGATVKSYDSTGSFSYTLTPKDYNYNYFVAQA
ncbi:hypothetical protein CI109_103613 [Kwoniella shandongensis]|uniref:Uncharacterized protein n=1 Tax=Kwoniella shandongensis TaxID=1734106 RepID=A0A5M6C802_9TREE|nr:uncharacterized protein CI109_000695 [Kwoniella shandongensis]KAA5531123.1 hypothetical protein CI109_000695 [Kwoniella shandongensis]